jgi:hypothetical protein
MTLRSARIDSASSSRSANPKRTPTPTIKEKTKKTARKGPSAAQIISNEPDSDSERPRGRPSMSGILKKGGKSPGKPEQAIQTLTVRDI